MNFNLTRKILFFISVAGLFISASAQNTRTIDENGLNKMREQFHSDKTATARMNAVSSNNIRKLSLNRENLGKLDMHFSNRIETAGITDQKSTGRCWLFTGLNVFRAKVINENNLSDFSFSHNFNFFYDQLEKANLFLEGIINTTDKPLDDKRVEWLFKSPIGDGGQWTGVADIIGKYGLVPSDVFPESFNSENTSLMSRMIRRKLREDGMNLRQMADEGKKEKELREEKEKMLADIYQMLAISLGEPPTEFQWRYEDKDGKLSEMKNYTPKSFYDEFVGIELDDYVMFMNDPSREYGKLYEIDYDRHIIEGKNWKYINLDIEKIKEFAKSSILSGEAMYFSCDVGKQFDKNHGTLDINNYDYDNLFGVDFGMDKKMRIQTYESGSTHGMALVAVDIVEGKIAKWLLENSWGDSGFDNGYLIMTDEWFNEYMFRLVVNKKFIDAETLKILDQEPTLLPPWDPMFSPED
jgi:bleomycin hydrolase